MSKKVLLYSGGMDSWLINQIEKPDIKLFFDLGTPSCKGEIKRLSKDVIIDRTLRGLGELENKDNFVVPLRNMYMIARATSYGEHIILGTIKTDNHNDKMLEFAKKLQDVLNYYYGPSLDHRSDEKSITVDFSYKKYIRDDLCRIYMERGGSVEKALKESFSCYTPIINGDSVTECHNCRPCFRKMMGFWVNGAKFPKGYLKTFIPYLENKLKEYKDKWGDRLYSKEQYLGVLEDCKKDLYESSSIKG